MANTFLEVPFKEKDEAKALGARWDAGAKKWYAPEGKDLVLFSAWLPANSRVSAPVAKAPSTGLAFADSGERTELANTKTGISLSELLAGVAQAVSQAFRAGVWTIVEVVEGVTTSKSHLCCQRTW